jgi:hypothetical protein
MTRENTNGPPVTPSGMRGRTGSGKPAETEPSPVLTGTSSALIVMAGPRAGHLSRHTNCRRVLEQVAGHDDEPTPCRASTIGSWFGQLVSVGG